MTWWTSPSLRAAPDGLHLDGHAVAALAALHGTPLFVYSLPTVRRRLAELRTALAGAAPRSRVLYAMKANRHPAVLELLRAQGVGLDACSPREVALALEAGFAPADVSLNAGMLSNRDLAAGRSAGVTFTLDTRSALRRLGRLAPAGTRVGLRVDPGVHAGYDADPKLAYGLSKFGFDAHEVPEALGVAREAGLVVEGLHTHLGWGLQATHAEAFEAALVRLARLAPMVPDLRWINVGGGLGARYRATDAPLPLDVWAAAIHRQLGSLDVEVRCEPGTFLVSDAGVLVVEVNTVETRRGVTWVGVDAGHAVNPSPALYGLPIAVVAVARPREKPVGTYTIAGHINEAIDVWARDVRLPALHEGDLLALLPAGAYASSMASDHCLRGGAAEIVVG